MPDRRPRRRSGRAPARRSLTGRPAGQGAAAVGRAGRLRRLRRLWRLWSGDALLAAALTPLPPPHEERRPRHSPPSRSPLIGRRPPARRIITAAALATPPPHWLRRRPQPRALRPPKLQDEDNSITRRKPGSLCYHKDERCLTKTVCKDFV
ncbi:uncharacterized protein LOC134807402 [Pan troglodytes]|uniref:uncharacterized protein LOC134807402 n=1 Tax=Pan troglodytes TaxID=9598 RepID=UPI0030132A14